MAPLALPNPNAPKNKGGRPKGRRNRTSALLKQAQEQIRMMYGEGIEFQNWDPVVMLLLTAANPNLKMELRIVAASKAAPYIHSMVKPIEAITDNTPKQIDIERIMSRAAKDLLIENKIPVGSLPESEPEEVLEEQYSSDEENPSEDEAL